MNRAVRRDNDSTELPDSAVQQPLRRDDAQGIGRVEVVRVDGAGELYIVSYGRGVVLKIIGPPPTPGGLRIIR